MDNIKCVAIGDNGVGKTSLLITYSTGVFPNDFVPTIFDNYSVTIEVEGREINLGLWDTAGDYDYDHLRPLSYKDCDVFLICFALNNRDSYDNVTSRWLPEIRRLCPAAKFVIVGTKLDLREEEDASNQANCVSLTEAYLMAKRADAVKYVECSSLKRINVKKVFDKAVINILYPDRKEANKSSCTIF